jgi:L-evernosamine nitrososynthase
MGLPGPQRDALSTAFGRLNGDAPNRFLVGLAVLGLLSDVAEEKPLLWIVDDEGSDDEVVAVFSEGQAAKAFVGDAAGRVVDRALALSGGAGYLNGSPLARAYRDVRAGAFMHPLGANRAYGFLARTALGLRPQLT